MILVGDIGGTKTVLALFSVAKGVSGGPFHETRYDSKKYDSLETIIREYLEQTEVKPIAACIGVAGPIENQQSQVTNLPWSIDSKTISTVFGIPEVMLINDLESIALAVPHLGKEDLATLNPGVVEPGGNIVVVAPGTGLGTAFLVWTGNDYKACASEGGHTSFAPRNDLEVELLKYLQRRHSHVSFERICSGGQVHNIYDFLRDEGKYQEPDWLRDELARVRDRTPIIVETARGNKAEICVATLDLFVNILGTVVGNMAITILPRGGIYLGGGIPPRILERLQQPDFLSRISEKGRVSSLCSSIPIHVILTSRANLYGAAWYGLGAGAEAGRLDV